MSDHCDTDIAGKQPKEQVSKRCVDCMHFKTKSITRTQINVPPMFRHYKPIQKLMFQWSETRIWYCKKERLPSPAYVDKHHIKNVNKIDCPKWEYSGDKEPEPRVREPEKKERAEYRPNA